MDKMAKTLLSYGLPILLSLSRKGEAIILNSLSIREREVLSTLVSQYYWETEERGQFIVVRETE